MKRCVQTCRFCRSLLAFQSPNPLLMRLRNFEKQPCRFFYIPDLSLHKLYRLGERFMPFGEPVHSCIEFCVGHSQSLGNSISMIALWLRGARTLHVRNLYTQWVNPRTQNPLVPVRVLVGLA